MKTLKELVEFSKGRTESYGNDKDRFVVILCENVNVKELIKENLIKLGLDNENGVGNIGNLYLFIRYGESSFFDMAENPNEKYGKPYLSGEIFWLA
jgi:hypothetical protein